LSNEIYEVLALAARYLFTILMLVIVLRAWKITIVDNRRARKLRQFAPETGLSGELVVLEGGEKAREGMRYPVIREGMIGSSRKADIRIRHSSIEPIHAYFELTEDGLKLRAHGGAPMSESWEDPVRRLLLRDGDVVELGNVQLLLVLTDARGGSRIAAPEPDSDPDDDIFGLGRSGQPRPTASEYDWDDEDNEDIPSPQGGRSGNDWKNPLAQPQRRSRSASERESSQCRGEKLFSSQIFPDNRDEDDDDIFEPRRRTRHKVESPLPGEGERRRRKETNNPDDEDFWL